ncbi:MAG: hypothetical protein GX455_08230 [Phycisphaerae bacterium]|nr:hypothetical protein [Phycisphaerae bacterium]
MTPMKMAARYGDFETIKSLVEGGVSPNGELENGITPLHLAAYGGYTKIVEYLISKGADVNLCRSDAHWNNGCTALHAAASAGHVEIMKFLLGKGAVVDHGTGDSVCYSSMGTGTALAQAVKCGQVQAVEFLLVKGADPRNAHVAGRSVLSYVRDSTVAAMLIDRGISVDTPDNQGITPLFRACQSDNAAVVQLLLLKGVKPRMIHEEVYLGQMDRIREQVKTGSSVNETYFGEPPLMFARTRPIAELLIDLGADIRFTRLTGAPSDPIYRACLFGRIEVVELFLDRGIDMNEVAKCLIFAVSQGHFNLLQMCMKRGLDLQKHGPDLLNSALAGKPEIARWLIQQGVDVNAMTRYHSSHLLSAVSHGNRESISLLFDAGARLRDDEDYLSPAIGQQHFWLVPVLLERGANVNGIGPNQRPLHAAISVGKTEIVRLLLEHGADPTLAIPNGGTPREIAQKWKKESICRLLDEYEQKPGTPQSSSITALD